MSHQLPEFARTFPAESPRFRPNHSDLIPLSFSKINDLLLLAVVISLLASSPSATGAPSAPELSCSLPTENGVHLSSDGVAELSWSAKGDSAYQLEQQTGESEFELRYEGPDLASVRSGLAAGEHRFRVRTLDEAQQPGPWAEIGVRVEYMDPSRVRFLLITGGIVVIATIFAIVHGHLTHRKEGSV